MKVRRDGVEWSVAMLEVQPPLFPDDDRWLVGLHLVSPRGRHFVWRTETGEGGVRLIMEAYNKGAEGQEGAPSRSAPNSVTTVSSGLQ